MDPVSNAIRDALRHGVQFAESPCTGRRGAGARALGYSRLLPFLFFFSPSRGWGRPHRRGGRRACPNGADRTAGDNREVISRLDARAERADRLVPGGRVGRAPRQKVLAASEGRRGSGREGQPGVRLTDSASVGVVNGAGEDHRVGGSVVGQDEAAAGRRPTAGTFEADRHWWGTLARSSSGLSEHEVPTRYGWSTSYPDWPSTWRPNMPMLATLERVGHDMHEMLTWSRTCAWTITASRHGLLRPPRHRNSP